MKKLLFCAGVLALAVSCTEDFESGSVQQEQAKGISFVATDGNDAATKGHFEEDGDFVQPFWWAEQDRISILSKNTKLGTGTPTAVTEWATITLNTATYKATQSQRKGVFTSVDDNNWLNFNNDKDAEFLAIYPASGSGSMTISGTVADSKTTYTISALPVLATQTQKDVNGNGVYENMVKWSYSTAKKENSYDAVGEKVDLNFQRVLSGMMFKTANASEYTVAPQGGTSIFGNLRTITAELVGAPKTEGEGYEKTASTPALTYNQDEATLKLTMPEKAGGEVKSELSKGEVTETPSGSTTKVVKDEYLKVTLNVNLPWNDNARAYMVTLPLELKNAKDNQYLKVIYEFANIEFVKYHALTAKDWVAGSFYAIPTLDINEYDYLLTNNSGTGANDRTLIVNRGNFADVFLASGNIEWPVGDAAGVAKTEVGKIIVKEGVNVTEDDVEGLGAFTNLTYIEMPGVAKIPAGAFNTDDSKNLAAQLKTIIMPDVTEIDPAFVAANLSVLEDLNLESYKFADETVNNKLFNTTTAGTLKILNMRGVTSMTPEFGTLRTLSFQNFTALTSVKVHENVRLCPNAFSGCINLAEVDGVVDMTNGSSAFKGAKALKEININGTDIPASAFQGCEQLTKVLYNGAQVAPTSVGAYAFEDVAKAAVDSKSQPVPFYMDLRNAKTIGVRAFEGSSLTSGKAGSQILTVGVETVEARIFCETKVCMVQFLNATKVQNGVFASSSANKTLKQVKFLKPFTYDATCSETDQPNKMAIFGGDNYSKGVVLFVCQDQNAKGAPWSDTTLTFGATTTPNKTSETTYTFKSITIEEGEFVEQ